MAAPVSAPAPTSKITNYSWSTNQVRDRRRAAGPVRGSDRHRRGLPVLPQQPGHPTADQLMSD
ncbi:hypothetical protein SCWH03_30880 [Streptomyces pacificus]|uniref:Uncharacterized protein n=1 Tax=Streptomyces pacificus TaxID=2705029 RepID=A0A6A0AWR1_9ACTN|nr:hypothetical protein SCWH03_30880 [Streptomyces pacificus]